MNVIPAHVKDAADRINGDIFAEICDGRRSQEDSFMLAIGIAAHAVGIATGFLHVAHERKGIALTEHEAVGLVLSILRDSLVVKQ